MIKRSMPPASAHLALMPVPAPPPRIGLPAATWARRRFRHSSRLKRLMRSLLLSPEMLRVLYRRMRRTGEEGRLASPARPGYDDADHRTGGGAMSTVAGKAMTAEAFL